MFDRFSDGARKLMGLERQNAIMFDHDYVGTEHILLGLVQHGSGGGAKVLRNLGIDLDQIRSEIERNIQQGLPKVLAEEDLPFSANAKQAIEFSVDEASAAWNPRVGSEYLLLGLLREKDGVAARVLRSLGVGLEPARKEVERQRGAVIQPSQEESKVVCAGCGAKVSKSARFCPQCGRSRKPGAT